MDLFLGSGKMNSANLKNYTAKQGDIIIVRGRNYGDQRTYNKYKIQDETELTYFLLNMDSDYKYRISKEMFNNNYEIVEILNEVENDETN